MMLGIRVKEVVALGVLLVAGLIGFMFLDPSASQGGWDRPPGTVSLGETPPETPVSTATPLPPAMGFPPPTRWRITYYDEFASGGYGLVADGARDGVLAIEHEGAPFSGSRDDAWKVEVWAPVELEAGRYAFELEYDCELSVRVAGAELVALADPAGVAHAEVDFVHGGGTVDIGITCVDVGGPVVLRWVASE